MNLSTFLVTLHKHPRVRDLLCTLGRHDYEPIRLVEQKGETWVELECFYCPNCKRSKLVVQPLHDPARLEFLEEMYAYIIDQENRAYQRFMDSHDEAESDGDVTETLFMDEVFSSLPPILDRDLHDRTFDTLKDFFARGFSVDDAVEFLMCMQEFEPDLSEDEALKRMDEIQKKYPRR